MNTRLQNIIESTQGLREDIINHPLNENIVSMEHLRSFMEHHIFAVWDYMSLLKALQKELTCTDLPWCPSSDGKLCSIINGLVMDAESTANLDGELQSQFDIYRDCMKSVGARTAGIDGLIAKVSRGESLVASLMTTGHLAPSAALFVLDTFNIIDKSRAHEIAAVFAFGREALLPAVFLKMVHNLKGEFPELSAYEVYMERYLNVHDEQNLANAFEMLEVLCGNDAIKWVEAEAAAKKALESRLNFWNAIEVNMNIAALAVV